VTLTLTYVIPESVRLGRNGRGDPVLGQRNVEVTVILDDAASADYRFNVLWVVRHSVTCGGEYLKMEFTNCRLLLHDNVAIIKLCKKTEILHSTNLSVRRPSECLLFAGTGGPGPITAVNSRGSSQRPSCRCLEHRLCLLGGSKQLLVIQLRNLLHTAILYVK